MKQIMDDRGPGEWLKLALFGAISIPVFFAVMIIAGAVLYFMAGSQS